MPPTTEVSANPMLATLPLYLVYDGSCGFCSRAVQFILSHERRHDLLFVPRESLRGRSFRSHFRLEAVESMLWIDGSQVKTESDAVLSAAKYLGGIWAMLGAIGSLVPAFLRNWVYRFIARNRRRLSASASSCLLPTADQQARFLE